MKRKIDISKWFDKCDSELVLFYDESGYPGKFYVTEKGINDKRAITNDFVLSGICYRKGEKINCIKLKKILDKYKINNEIKYSKIRRKYKNFLGITRSKLFRKVTDFILKENIFVHFSYIDNWFWAIADIVDACMGVDKEFILTYNSELKTTLYDFSKKHIDQFICLMNKHKFPKLRNISLFYYELIELINKFNKKDQKEYAWVEKLKLIFCAAVDFELIDDIFEENGECILLKKYWDFYMNRICCLYKSFHLFDQQNQISRQLNKYEFYFKKTRIKNFVFLDSKKNLLIQLSDLIAGFIRELLIFLDSNQKILDSDVVNLRKICKIFNKLDSFEFMLAHRITSFYKHRQRVIKLYKLAKMNVLSNKWE